MSKKISQTIVTSNSLHVDVEVGKYAGFLINFNGTAKSTKTVLTSMLGKIRMVKDGQQKQMIEIDRLFNANAIRNGAPANTSGAGAAYNFSVFLPTRVQGDFQNCLDVGSVGEVTLELDNFYDSVEMEATGTVRVAGLLANPDSTEEYILNIAQKDFSAGVGTTPQSLSNLPNIESVFVGYNANITDLQLLVDGVAMCQGEAILQNDITNLMSFIETYSGTLGLTELRAQNNYGRPFNKSTSVSVTVKTAAITAETTVFHVEYV